MTSLEDSDIGVDCKLEQREAAGEIFRFVETLPKNQREVVYFKFQCDLSYKEISEVTKLSIGNVGFLLHHALAAILSGCFRNRQGGDHDAHQSRRPQMDGLRAG